MLTRLMRRYRRFRNRDLMAWAMANEPVHPDFETATRGVYRHECLKAWQSGTLSVMRDDESPAPVLMDGKAMLERMKTSFNRYRLRLALKTWASTAERMGAPDLAKLIRLSGMHWWEGTEERAAAALVREASSEVAERLK